MIFKFIKAATFFPSFAPTVMNWKHKIRGKNGRGNPVDFTSEDMRSIDAGLKSMNRAIAGYLSYKKANPDNKK